MPRALARVGRLAAVVGLLAPLLSGCGYSLAGRGSFLPDYIKVVGVPTFVNRTSTFNLDQIVTAQVRQEFQSRGGRYRVVPEANGDAVLTGTITDIRLTPANVNANQQATRYIVVVTASVEFRDTHTNKVIWSNPSLQGREEYNISSAGSATPDAGQFFGQNTASLTRLAQTFARSVVTAVLENF